ncbi:glycosyltransferase [Mycolicibacterium sp. A43C]
MAKIIVVAEYREQPSEGMQVISKTLVDALRSSRHCVRVVEPGGLKALGLALARVRPDVVLFTHGPGPGVVKMSLLLRVLLRAKIIWIASRPDLESVPGWLRGRRTANVVVCNQRRPDLDSVACGANFVERFIGIDPARVRSCTDVSHPWPDLVVPGRPVLLHVGHLKRNRGLEMLAEAKRELGGRIEVVVQGGPAIPPDPGVVEELQSAGVHVRRTFEPSLRRLYEAADLYVFPVQHAAAGAIELPLGVLEAIANQTPVLTTEFGVLKQALSEERGVTFVGKEGFTPALQALLDDGGLAVKPWGLPEHLSSDRTVEAVLQLLGTV